MRGLSHILGRRSAGGRNRRGTRGPAHPRWDAGCDRHLGDAAHDRFGRTFRTAFRHPWRRTVRQGLDHSFGRILGHADDHSLGGRLGRPRTSGSPSALRPDLRLPLDLTPRRRRERGVAASRSAAPARRA
ncbi:hypothetical protein ACFRCI_10890 [Streptomyces sp. NPDC056638]|uniref:hypothetical protein n=1 Tax=Streptomyces sp. NPDC056638 TaxID=3345887 RepID=UPI003675B2D9